MFEENDLVKVEDVSGLPIEEIIKKLGDYTFEDYCHETMYDEELTEEELVEKIKTDLINKNYDMDYLLDINCEDDVISLLREARFKEIQSIYNLEKNDYTDYNLKNILTFQFNIHGETYKLGYKKINLNKINEKLFKNDIIIKGIETVKVEYNDFQNGLQKTICILEKSDHYWVTYENDKTMLEYCFENFQDALNYYIDSSNLKNYSKEYRYSYDLKSSF